MRKVLLAALLTAAAGCASNRNDESVPRIQDTTLTSADTASDSLPHIRDSVMDSAQ